MSRRLVLCIIFYCLITVIFTYPVAFKMDKLAGGLGGIDSLMFAWNLWWVKKALIALGGTLLRTDWIFYPVGADLTYHTLSIFNGIVSIPLQYFFNLIITYNIILLSTFVISALTAFFLIYYIGKDIKVSFIGGIMFSFTPYHFVHATVHLNHATIQFLPLIVLFLLRLTDKPNIKDGLYLALSLTLNFYSCYYYAVYTGYFILIFLVYLTLNRRINWGFLKYLGVSMSIYIIATIPILYNFIKIFFQKDVYLHTGYENIFVADLLSFFIPHPNNFISKKLGLLSIYSRFSGFNFSHEIIRFVGYTTIVLSLVALFKVKFKAKWFWAFTGLFFFILSLGPSLHVLGRTYFPSVRLPFYWLVQEVPFVRNARIPSRFAIMGVLSLTVLACYGYYYLDSLIRKRITKYIFCIIISCLVSLDLYCGQFPQISIDIPKFYNDIAEDKEDYAILEFPFHVSHEVIERYMFYQTIHNKKICSGRLSRGEPIEAVWERVGAFDEEELKKDRIKYIVVHPEVMSEEDKRYLDIFNEKFRRVPVEDSSIIVYEIGG